MCAFSSFKSKHIRISIVFRTSLVLTQPVASLYLIAHLGLPSHPQHEIAKSQCTGFGGMVCFKVKGGKSITRKFMMNLKVIDSQL